MNEYDLQGYVPSIIASHRVKYLSPDPTGYNENPCSQTFPSNTELINMINTSYKFPHKRLLAIYTDTSQFPGFPPSSGNKAMGNCIIIPITNENDKPINKYLKSDIEQGVYSTTHCAKILGNDIQITYLVDPSVTGKIKFVKPPGIKGRAVRVCPPQETGDFYIYIFVFLLALFIIARM